MSAPETKEVTRALRERMETYSPLSDQTWDQLKKFCRVYPVSKDQVLLNVGDIPTSFFFVYSGLFRSYSLGGSDGSKEIIKTFFEEGRFPASTCALLEQSESQFSLQALENSIVVEIDHKKYRNLLEKSDDLKMYHINYLECHWVREKEPQEASLLGNDASSRYLEFQARYPHIANRVPLYHLASRLGITPTQLSRIRKKLA